MKTGEFHCRKSERFGRRLGAAVSLGIGALALSCLAQFGGVQPVDARVQPPIPRQVGGTPIPDGEAIEPNAVDSCEGYTSPTLLDAAVNQADGTNPHLFACDPSVTSQEPLWSYVLYKGPDGHVFAADNTQTNGQQLGKLIESNGPNSWSLWTQDTRVCGYVIPAIGTFPQTLYTGMLRDSKYVVIQIGDSGWVRINSNGVENCTALSDSEMSNLQAGNPPYDVRTDCDSQYNTGLSTECRGPRTPTPEFTSTPEAQPTATPTGGGSGGNSVVYLAVVRASDLQPTATPEPTVTLTATPPLRTPTPPPTRQPTSTPTVTPTRTPEPTATPTSLPEGAYIQRCPNDQDVCVAEVPAFIDPNTGQVVDLYVTPILCFPNTDGERYCYILYDLAAVVGSVSNSSIGLYPITLDMFYSGNDYPDIPQCAYIGTLYPPQIIAEGTGFTPIPFSFIQDPNFPDDSLDPSFADYVVCADPAVGRSLGTQPNAAK